MGWTTKLEYVDSLPFSSDWVMKSTWDPETKQWQKFKQWRIPYNSDTHQWLKENYKTGWFKTFDKLAMSEDILLMYRLKFGK